MSHDKVFNLAISFHFWLGNLSLVGVVWRAMSEAPPFDPEKGKVNYVKIKDRPVWQKLGT